MKKVIYKDGFVMVDKYILDRRPVKRLLKNSKKGEGATNLGIYLTAIVVLTNSADGIGDEFTVKEIAEKCGKCAKAVKRVVANDELFVHAAGGTFRCRVLCEAKVEKDIEVIEPVLNSGATLSGPSRDSDTPISAHVKTKNKINKRNTAEAVKEPAAASDSFDFNRTIDGIFRDTRWLALMEKKNNIRLCTDKRLCDMVRRAFSERVHEKCLWQSGEPYNEYTIKNFFSNWIRPGAKSRTSLDSDLERFYYGSADDADPTDDEDNGEERTPAINAELEYYDLQGRRRGPYHELVDKLAPPCPSVKHRYSRRSHQWKEYGC